MSLQGADGSMRKLRGLAFAKQFPNPAEPLRGLFVMDQVMATRGEVDWSVIAPVPYVPRALAPLLGRPFVKGPDVVSGIDVARPRYPVLPRRILYSSVGRSMGLAAARSLRRTLDRDEVDFIHAHALYPSAAAAVIALGQRDVPLVVTVHGSDLYTNVVRPSWKHCLTPVIERASRIICVSERLKNDLSHEFPDAGDRVVVIPDAYDDERFALIRRANPDGRGLRLLSVGNLRPVKGHDVLIRAFASAIDAGLDASLTIVGQGSEGESLAALAASLRCADRIRFTGALGEKRLLDEYAKADAFVLASRSEGFGVVYTEALATGLPVIATRCGGPEDIVTEADGRFVPVEDASALADALLDLPHEITGYDPPSIAARARTRFSRAAVGERLVELYRSLAMERR